MKVNERYRTCIHEAGHTVQSIEAGYKVLTVGVGSPTKNPMISKMFKERDFKTNNGLDTKEDMDKFFGECGGYTMIDNGATEFKYSPNTPDTEKRQRLNEKLAGVAAEIVVTGTEVGCIHDKEMAMTICKLYGNIPYRPQLIASIKASKQKKNVIIRLADVIYEKGCLSQEEINKVLAGEI